jgi:hypothetical protein
VTAFRQRQFKPEDLLTLGASQRQHAVGGDAVDRLGEVIELLGLAAVAVGVDGFGAQDAAAKFLAEASAGGRLVHDAIRENAQRAFERRLGGWQTVLCRDVGLREFGQDHVWDWFCWDWFCGGRGRGCDRSCNFDAGLCHRVFGRCCFYRSIRVAGFIRHVARRGRFDLGGAFR